MATMLKLPVSGTHSVLGAVLGFHILEKGLQGIKGWSLLTVVSSWFLSPMLAALFSATMYMLLQKILAYLASPNCTTSNLLQLQILPLIYAICFLVNAFSILFDGPTYLSPDFGQRLYSFLFAFLISSIGN